MRRQRQEEWEAKVEHLKREIKKGQIHWLWDRWRKAYLEKKEQQRKTEEVSACVVCVACVIS
jgi:succinate dehydrogenase/fumarate reductase-like Fe-S protein